MSRISSPSLSLTRRASSSVTTKAPSFGEVAGGTAAECAAICCCGPCLLVDFLILTVYNVPTGLCRAVLRRRRREKLLKKGLLFPSKTSIGRCNCGFEDYGYACNCQSSLKELLLFEEYNNNNDNNSQVEAMVRLEKEMWDTFYETGFWRSPSRREDVPPLPPPPPCFAPAEADLLLL